MLLPATENAADGMNVAPRLPDFIAVGAIKAASSSLHHYLCQHPQIVLPRRRKELKFFHWDQQREIRCGNGPGDHRIYSQSIIDWGKYLAEFQVTEATRAIGEVCPSYLFDAHAMERIAERLPNARIIAILRDPTARAFSHYLHSRRLGKEAAKSFEEALALEDRRVADGWGINWQYAGQGFYVHQIEHLWRLFPRQQVRICEFDEFVNGPQQFLHSIFEFLGVDPDLTPDTSTKHNQGDEAPRSTRLKRFLNKPHWTKNLVRHLLPGAARDYVYRTFTDLNSQAAPQLDPRTRQLLSLRYESEITQLEEMLGRDLGHWKHSVDSRADS